MISQTECACIILDDEGLLSIQDLCYLFLKEIIMNLSKREKGEVEDFHYKIGFIVRIKAASLTFFNEFLLAFYIFEKKCKANFISLLYVYVHESGIIKIIESRAVVLSQFDRFVISGKHAFANEWYMSLKSLFKKPKIHFI